MKIKLILLLIFLISCSSETSTESLNEVNNDEDEYLEEEYTEDSDEEEYTCLVYTSPSPRDS